MQPDSAENYGSDFERSLVSSTPKKSPCTSGSPQSSTRIRKTASVSEAVSEADNTTFYKSDTEVFEYLVCILHKITIYGLS